MNSSNHGSLFDHNDSFSRKELFHLPDRRQSLFDRITKAYFKRKPFGDRQNSLQGCGDEYSEHSEQKPPFEAHPGPRLYKNGLRLQKKKQSLLVERQLVVKDKEMEECSFTPDIGENSRELDPSRDQRSRRKTHNILFEHSKQPNSRISSLRSLKQHKEIEELQPKPTINYMYTLG